MARNRQCLIIPPRKIERGPTMTVEGETSPNVVMIVRFPNLPALAIMKTKRGPTMLRLRTVCSALEGRRTGKEKREDESG